MVRAIMHGCNGHMGQVISGLIKDDPEIEIVAVTTVIRYFFLLINVR